MGRSVEPEWLEVCQKLRDGQYWVPHTEIFLADLPSLIEEFSLLPKVICWTNKTRHMINQRCSELWQSVLGNEGALKLPETTFTDEEGEKRQFTYYTGMPIMCKKTNKTGAFHNNQLGYIKSVELHDAHTWVVIAHADSDATGLWSEIGPTRQPAFAVTDHVAEDLTLEQRYAVCEWDRMDSRMRHSV